MRGNKSAGGGSRTHPGPFHSPTLVLKTREHCDILNVALSCGLERVPIINPPFADNSPLYDFRIINYSLSFFQSKTDLSLRSSKMEEKWKK